MKYDTVLIVIISCATFISTTPTEKAAIACLKDSAIAISGGRIIGGKAAALGQFPWQVAVFVRSDLGHIFCGGALISAEWVLTAGHCTTEVYDIKLQLGSLSLGDLDDDRVIVETNTFFRHKNYSSPDFGLKNDIALIKLDQPVQLSETIQPIALDEGHLVQVNTPVTVSGWGKRRDAQLAVNNLLYYTNLTTISAEECKKIYSRMPEGTMCTRGVNSNENICQGDSGGPLITYTKNGPVHVGVVSFGNSEGCEVGAPAGYAETSYYRNWIRDISGV